MGIHFTSAGQMILQCRGHEITEGMHPQYNLFKQWTAVKRSALESILSIFTPAAVRIRRQGHGTWQESRGVARTKNSISQTHPMAQSASH